MSAFLRREAVSNYSGDRLFARQAGLKMGIKNPEHSADWNWGAFSFSWLWLLNHGNRRRAALFFLFDLVPIIGIFAHMYCGLRGSDIAFDGRRFESIEHYRAVQRAWRNWSVVPLLLWAFAAAVAANAHRGEFANVVQHIVASSEHDRTPRTDVGDVQPHPATRTVAAAPVQAPRQTRISAVTSSTRAAATSSTRAAAPSSTRAAAPSSTRAKAPSSTRAKAPSSTRAKAPSSTRAAAPASTRAAAPASTRAATLSPRANVRAGSSAVAPSAQAGRVSRSAGTCNAAFRSLAEAALAETLHAKLAASISAIHDANSCSDTSAARQLRGIAFAQKALAENGLNSGDWQADISTSIVLSSQCAIDKAITKIGARADCYQLAQFASRLKASWQAQAPHARLRTPLISAPRASS